jgi:hypothetical protein
MRLSVSKIGLIALAAFAGIAIASEDAPPEHIQWMKDLNDQNGAIRKGVDVEKNAAAMLETMKHVQAFWAKRSSDVAAKASTDTIQGATQIAQRRQGSDDRRNEARGCGLPRVSYAAPREGLGDAIEDKVEFSTKRRRGLGVHPCPLFSCC